MDHKGAARKGKSNTIDGAFAWRKIEMLESPAYRALSLAGHRILARLEIELYHHGGKENGCLPTTFDQFEDYGIHRQAIAPAIRETVALGFVEITERGRAGNAEWRRPSLYRLTYRHTDTTRATDDWRRVETQVEADRIAAAARSDKAKSQYRKPYHTSVRKPHLSDALLGTETNTTGHSTETNTTSISRGGSGVVIIAEVLGLIRGTGLDTADYRDRICKLTPNDQVRAAKRDLKILKEKKAQKVHSI